MASEDESKALSQLKLENKGGKYVKLNIGGSLFQTTISTLTKVRKKFHQSVSNDFSLIFLSSA